MELEIRCPASVEWCHECRAHVRVGEAEGVAELVGRGLQEVGPLEGVDGPVLLHGQRRADGFGRVSYGQTDGKIAEYSEEQSSDVLL